MRRRDLLSSVVLLGLTPSLRSIGPDLPRIDQSLLDFVLEANGKLPGEGSNRFVVGRPDEVALAANGIVAASEGRLDDAVALLARVDYELVEVRDPVHGIFRVVHETPAIKRGWGSYYLRPVPTHDVTVQVPHPRFDKYTPDFGVEAFHRSQASVLLVAGTHRYANGRPSNGWEPPSDMARNPDSLFQAVHQRLSTVSTHVLQYHGFVEDGYPDVVLSNGSATPHAELGRIASRMVAAGVTAEVFDGVNWPSVGATKNPQAKHTRAIGGRFYHMEHQARLRSAMVQAVAAELG